MLLCSCYIVGSNLDMKSKQKKLENKSTAKELPKHLHEVILNQVRLIYVWLLCMRSCYVYVCLFVCVCVYVCVCTCVCDTLILKQGWS